MIARRAISAATMEIEWEPFMWSYAVDLEEAWGIFKRQLDGLVGAAQADRFVVALSSPLNFRKAVYPPYKAKRGPWPLGYAAFRELIKSKLAVPEGEHYQVREEPGLEADDVLGILGTLAREWEVPIIWSDDKDLKQIPGLHLDLEDGVYEVSLAEADRVHAMQTLTGDTVDGYPGCPGMGPVKAERLLDKAGANPWPAIAEAYTKAGKTHDEFLAQARVARILRAEDFNFDTRQPIMWEPPSA
jgi:DNA polymerase-1